VRLLWTSQGWEDFEHWLDHDPAVAERVRALLKDLRRTPFQGLGKPEPLKGAFQGFWSRRITQEHRLVYAVEGAGEDRRAIILQCRYHY
jgi:toxin YoeB